MRNCHQIKVKKSSKVDDIQLSLHSLILDKPSSESYNSSISSNSSEGYNLHYFLIYKIIVTMLV